MRITTGKYRNRKLFMPRGIRPTQDKVRKAIFDILGDVEGLSFLELYAGSGAVGFEALSRGVVELTMVECNHNSVLTIKKNIALLKAPGCNLYYLDVEKAIKLLARDKKSFDIIFLDPPYHEGMAKKILQTLEGYDILSPNGLIIAQHPKTELLPESSPNFSLIKEAKYGDTWLSIFSKKK
ncbi:MAG: 16S rRNA (guanine(966)-N(2))-methyltransferase RsmD [Candidatus Omnitrophica bacterium]|jgi:16S rRNA (guanine966-N2)-methyltransferase|nr:16S rRNA (guanine(966)-N(2))-methyltransferase RsmD [Candidatus Omnitrophota bacterium]MDD5690915.1 16S rRNA (guanine(966)-N(2))-methyltransferase RsmD [Candidatus Omnitrophota bacterium]